MALEKHLPRGSRAVDMKKNFPEMFLTHEQVRCLPSNLLIQKVKNTCVKLTGLYSVTRKIKK